MGKSFYQTLSHNNLLENFLQRLKNKKHFLASDFLDFSCLDELFKKSKEAPIDDFHAYLRKLGHSVQLEQKNEFFKRDAARMLYSRVYQEFRKIKKRLLTVETLGEYLPTPEKVVENMLHVANLKQGEKLIDLGSGDGRVCFMAAQKFGAVATGCEINKKLWAESQEKLKNNNLESQVKLLNKSIEKTDLKDFDVITLYSNHFGQFKLLEHVLASAKPGARVVAHSDYYGRRFFEAAKTICVEKGKLAPSFIHLWEIK